MLFLETKPRFIPVPRLRIDNNRTMICNLTLNKFSRGSKHFWVGCKFIITELIALGRIMKQQSMVPSQLQTGRKSISAVSKKTDTKWNSSTNCGTASQKCGTVPPVQFDPLIHNLLNWDPLTGPVPLLRKLFQIFGTLFPFCGTVPLFSGSIP